MSGGDDVWLGKIVVVLMCGRWGWCVVCVGGGWWQWLCGESDGSGGVSV